MITAHVIGDTIRSSSPDAFAGFERSRFGEKKNNKIGYLGVEALYLVEKGKMQIFSGKKELDFDELLKKMRRKDRRVETKFAVFRDLRRKGYLVKTALKFGADFRVYEKGVRPGQDHARWVLTAVRESESLKWHDFAAKNRVAHSTKKNLLIGVVDEEGGVSYYEVGWIRP